MAFDPLKIGTLSRGQTFVERNKRLPQIVISHGLFLGVAPTIGFPFHPPTIFKAVHDIGRVTHNDQPLHLGLSDRHIGLQGFESRSEFHTLIGRLGLTARTGAFTRRSQSPRPTAWAWVTTARPIGVDD